MKVRGFHKKLRQQTGKKRDTLKDGWKKMDYYQEHVNVNAC